MGTVKPPESSHDDCWRDGSPIAGLRCWSGLAEPSGSPARECSIRFSKRRFETDRRLSCRTPQRSAGRRRREDASPFRHHQATHLLVVSQTTAAGSSLYARTSCRPAPTKAPKNNSTFSPIPSGQFGVHRRGQGGEGRAFPCYLMPISAGRPLSRRTKTRTRSITSTSTATLSTSTKAHSHPSIPTRAQSLFHFKLDCHLQRSGPVPCSEAALPPAN